MKLYEEFKLYENMWESTGVTAIIYAGNFRNESRLEQEAAKASPSYTINTDSILDFFRQYDNAVNKASIKLYTDAEGKAELEELCADMPANMKKKILNTAILVEWKTASNANVNTTSSSQTTTTAAQPKLTWEGLLAKADDLLDELIGISGNTEYDDGDGYWQSEYDIWCNRYLYYSDTLENTAQLKKLCTEYSKKLPNVEFYFVEDKDLEISEIGYTATREDE